VSSFLGERFKLIEHILELILLRLHLLHLNVQVVGHALGISHLLECFGAQFDNVCNLSLVQPKLVFSAVLNYILDGVIDLLFDLGGNSFNFILEQSLHLAYFLFDRFSLLANRFKLTLHFFVETADLGVDVSDNTLDDGHVISPLTLESH
jgi:hypothetical protein